MMNVVVVLQEENWGDDGGDHDPVLVTLTPAQFARVSAMTSRTIEGRDTDALNAILRATPTPTLPCELHGVFNIWFSNGG